MLPTALPALARAAGPLLKWAALLLACAALIGGPLLAVRHAHRAGYQAGHTAATAAAQAAAATAAESARLADRARHHAATLAAQEVDLATHRALRAAQARAAAARSDVDRLRHALTTLATRPPEPHADYAACTQRLADVERHRRGLADLLLQGAELAAELTQRGDAAAAALAGLQQHVARVGLVPVNPAAPAHD